jgi:hypothetical protein
MQRKRLFLARDASRKLQAVAVQPPPPPPPLAVYQSRFEALAHNVIAQIAMFISCSEFVSMLAITSRAKTLSVLPVLLPRQRGALMYYLVKIWSPAHSTAIAPLDIALSGAIDHSSDSVLDTLSDHIFVFTPEKPPERLVTIFTNQERQEQLGGGEPIRLTTSYMLKRLIHAHERSSLCHLLNALGRKFDVHVQYEGCSLSVGALAVRMERADVFRSLLASGHVSPTERTVTFSDGRSYTEAEHILHVISRRFWEHHPAPPPVLRQKMPNAIGEALLCLDAIIESAPQMLDYKFGLGFPRNTPPFYCVPECDIAHCISAFDRLLQQGHFSDRTTIGSKLTERIELRAIDRDCTAEFRKAVVAHEQANDQTSQSRRGRRRN